MFSSFSSVPVPDRRTDDSDGENLTSFFKPTAEQSDGGHAENDQDSSSSSSNIYDDGEDENENDGPTMHETDSLLAQTLNKLSMRERDEALQDLHGVADTQSETPGFVEKSLKDFNEELEKVKSKKAYYMAKSISLNYVSNKKIRLQFLRAENYNAKNAANRMVMFFESKLEIFGKTRLTQDIRLSDFSKEDLANFEKGYLHLLPQKDRAGRTIICTIGVMAATIPVETRRRLLMYIFCKAASEEMSQTKGAVVIYYGVGHRRFFLDRGTKITTLLRCVPVRISAIHCCYDNILVRPLLSAASYCMDQNALCRLRFHYGAHLECMYFLMTFGIPRDILPFHSDGRPKLDDIPNWLAMRLKEESVMPLETVVVVPGMQDVLLGRGKRVQESAGNFRFKHLLGTHREHYERVSKFEKTIVAESILRLVNESGGRFLKQGDCGWTQVEDEMARKKISHAFRNLRVTPSSIARNSSSAKLKRASLLTFQPSKFQSPK